MITVRVLNDSDLVDNACELLYKVYIEEAKWMFSKNNPSLLRVEIKKGKKLLIDRFVEKAVWFGAFDNGLLIGCARLCSTDENGKFEVEGYKNSKNISKYLSNNDFEMGKVAVKKEYKGQKVLHLLYLKAFEYARHYEKSVFGCLSNSIIKGLFKQIELPLKMQNAFKYEDHDYKPVNFYYIDYKKNEYEIVLNNLKNLLPQSYLSYPSIFEMLEVLSLVMPIPMYWHDVNGKLLGINKHCLEGMGTTREKVIYKTPYDFYPKEIAEYILAHNKKVMETKQTLSQEEVINNLTTNKTVYAKAVKSPLYDEFGNVIGIIGISVDITAEKENEFLKAKVEAQNIFKECIDKIHNDLETSRLKVINSSIGNNKNIAHENIDLTKRQGEILYLASVGKNVKQIANILSVKDDKNLTSATINVIINKHLYPKFNVNNLSDLIEKAKILNLIPFLHNSFIDIAD